MERALGLLVLMVLVLGLPEANTAPPPPSLFGQRLALSHGPARRNRYAGFDQDLAPVQATWLTVIWVGPAVPWVVVMGALFWEVFFGGIGKV